MEQVQICLHASIPQSTRNRLMREWKAGQRTRDGCAAVTDCLGGSLCAEKEAEVACLAGFLHMNDTKNVNPGASTLVRTQGCVVDHCSPGTKRGADAQKSGQEPRMQCCGHG